MLAVAPPFFLNNVVAMDSATNSGQMITGYKSFGNYHISDRILFTDDFGKSAVGGDKALEMGLDWWSGNPAFDSRARAPALPSPEIEERLNRLEARLKEPELVPEKIA